MATINAQPKGQAIGAKNRSSTPGPAPRATSNSTANSSSNLTETHREFNEPPRERQTQSIDKGVSALDQKTLRAGFLRKVYGILTAQMLITVSVAAACMFTPPIRNFFLRIEQHKGSWFNFLIFAPTIASLLILNLGAKSRYPMNYILLSVFTLGVSIDVGYICALLQVLGYGHIILQASAATAIVFIGLSVYALYSGRNFSYMRGFLAVALWGLCITGLVGLFFPWMASSLACGFAGALTFCGYILFDTWRLQSEFSYDDYIPATIELYLDIVNLFLYIVKILIWLQKDGLKKIIKGK